MKLVVYLIALNMLLVSCQPGKIKIIPNGYLGMTSEEYVKNFNGVYSLNTSSSKVAGKLNPIFNRGHLTSLSIHIDQISDFDTAYNVYELGNDLTEKYGTPYEKKETIWAGGCSKYLKWKKGSLEIAYSYRYNQVPGTSGLLYTGEANVAFNSHRNFRF